MEGYFIFKNQSSKDFGLLIYEMPNRIKAERKQTEITIAGRSGYFTEDENETYKPYDLSFSCSTRLCKRLDEIVAWLDGSGDLIVSTEKDKVYRAKVSGSIKISDVIYLYQKILITFRVQPFKYSRNAISDTLTLTAPATIYNRGTIYSTPIITIYGTGDMDFTINGTSFGLTDVVDSITVNCEIEEVYKDGVGCNLQYIGSAFPRLAVGGNAITWTGNVTKVVVEPQWRWR